MAVSRVPDRAYRTGVTSVRWPTEARERILLAAAVADLREAVYAQQCLLEALVQALAEQGLVDEAELRDRADTLA